MLPWTHPSPYGPYLNRISIGSAVFAVLMIVTENPTDHATSVTTGRIYVRTAAVMRPNNNRPTCRLLTVFKYSAEVYEHVGEGLHLFAVLEQLGQVVWTARCW